MVKSKEAEGTTLDSLGRESARAANLVATLAIAKRSFSQTKEELQ